MYSVMFRICLYKTLFHLSINSSFGLPNLFPLLKNFHIINLKSQSSCNLNTFSPDNNQSNSIAEFPHLTYLDMLCANINYLEQFLNERKTYVPCLTKLRVVLRNVTNNFTREEMQRNCAKMKQLIMMIKLVHSKDFYLYFPSL
jgi:hypothetical protein